MSAAATMYPAERRPLISTDLATVSMNERLVEYGDCYIRGGEGVAFQIYRDDKPEERPTRYTGQQIEAARLLHRTILMLEIRHSLVVQVFYGEPVSRRWDDLKWETQAQIIDDLTHWSGGVNHRLRKRCRELRISPMRIRSDEFMPIRNAAIAQLIRLDRARAGIYPLTFPCG